MSYTGGTPGKSFGTCWYQQARCSYIKNLKSNIVNALRHYYNFNNVYPRQVVVYRGGVSEGEYRIVSLKVKSSKIIIKKLFKSNFTYLFFLFFTTFICNFLKLILRLNPIFLI